MTNALLALPLGLLIGLSLGALGGGGSVLTVPALVYVLDQTPRHATSGSLIIVGLTALTGATGHARHHRVRWAPGLVFGAVGVAGSLLGSRLNRQVDPTVLLLGFAGLMVVVAAVMLKRLPKQQPAAGHINGPSITHAPGPLLTPTPVGSQVDAGHGSGATLTAVASQVSTFSKVTEAAPAPRQTLTSWDTAWKVVLAGTVVGFMTGFFGVGGGFVVVPALVLALGFTMPEAVGTSLLVIAINSAVALGARAGTVTFPWGVLIPFTLAAMTGSLFGNRIASRVNSVTLAKAFAALLLLLAVYVASQSISSLS